MSDINMTGEIGLRIRDLRKGLGWSQAELAMRAGTTQQSIQRYEAGASEPKISALLDIAKVCGVSVSFLLGQSEEACTEATVLSGEERRLIGYFRVTDPRGRGTIMRVAEGEAMATLVREVGKAREE